MKILFVCTGNTCRSFMAEAMLRDMLKGRELDHIEVGSAGLAAMPGAGPSLNAVKVLSEKEIGPGSHQASRLDLEMLEKADLILTMTQGHKDAILSVRPAIWTKIHTLNEYVGLEEKDISDPYGGSEATYRESLASIERALVRLIDIIAG